MMEEQDLQELQNDLAEPSYRPMPLPWIMAGCGFLFLSGLLYASNNQALSSLPRPVFSNPFSAPPPEVGPPQAVPGQIVNNVTAPGAVQVSQSEWQAVTQLSGAGPHHSSRFQIRSPFWRVRWTTPQTNDKQNWFYGFVYRSDGKRIAGLNNVPQSLQIKGEGIYYIDVNATQNWSLTIEEWR